MNIQANIEIFHLLFLRQLEGKLDKKLYALKGGCNLRFYFKSIRYSEDIDIDFDVSIISDEYKAMYDSTERWESMRDAIVQVLLKGHGHASA